MWEKKTNLIILLKQGYHHRWAKQGRDERNSFDYIIKASLSSPMGKIGIKAVLIL